MADSTLHTQQLRSGEQIVALRRRGLRLLVTRGPDRKQRCDVHADRMIIGTHPGADLVLSDATVSRQHCEIALVDGGYAIRDLDSTNGTFLGDVRVGEVVVPGASKLRVGDSVIQLSPLADAVDIPLADETRFGPLLGRSVAMRRVFELLGRVAASDATVLVTGESGTGKELAARAIHEASARRERPFVVVDCAGLPPTLIESALYGHERGAFTGAVDARPGAFEAADGGTVFLDEIGELPLEMQTRLLGVVERREVQRLGSHRGRSLDVRIVAATNRDLRREVNRGAFREDLYFRLAVVEVRMPALRERPEDIPLYVEEMLRDQPTVSIDTAAMDELSRHRWPGNVRELRNVVERMAALGTVAELAPASMPAIASEIDVAVPFKIGKAALIEQYERSYAERLMVAHDQNITRAARAAEIDRVYLLRILDKYGLRPGRK